MKILWIVNIMFPEALELLDAGSHHMSSGGWMIGAAEELVKRQDVELSIVSVSSRVNEIVYLDGDKIHYCIVPLCINSKKYSSYFSEINKTINPNIVHIHGTEYSYGWAWLRINPSSNVVVSIQGLVGVIAKYYRAGLTLKEILCNITIHDFLKRTIIGEQRNFYRRGKIEEQVLRKVGHVIGRTSFDKAHCCSINPNLKYHFCNETMRSEFYTGQWSYDSCVPHTIFLSQATYPLKGLHIVLKALPLVKRKYPDVKMRIAGKDITYKSGLKARLRYTGYGNYLHKLIHKYKLEDTVRFIGLLDAEGMKREYLSANVFVSPSAIENSPNSIGEAQLLGVPVVASFVGGVMDMMKGNESNLYRYEEVEMLAEKICSVFSHKPEQSQLLNMRKQALIRHDAERNVNALMEVYNKIIKNN